MKIQKILIFMVLFFAVYCINDYKSERKKWALQYRNQIQNDFIGFNTIEDLLINFINDTLNNQDLNKYFLTDDEYLRIYWANQPWEKIFDKGMTQENTTYLYNLFRSKNIIKTRQLLEKIKIPDKIENIRINIKKKEALENNELIYFDSVYLISKIQKEIALDLEGVVIKHNQKYKLIQIKPND